ncbi:ankyrin repeat protein, partial [Colletotrichum musicola]
MAGEADPSDLWGEALGQLSEEDRRVIEESQLSESKLETLNHICRAAEQEKQRCIETGWGVYTTTSGKKIKLRHVLEKISAWVSELINVVNVAVAFDASGNAAAPWGVAATSNIAVFTDLVEAKKYFESGTIKKMGHGIRDFLAKEYKNLLESISEVEVENWLRIAERLHKDTAERHRVLKETLERLDQPIMKMAVQLSAVQDQLDYEKRIKVFQWMSKIPYGSHFEQSAKNLLEDSGQWLLESREYSDWLSSNESCVLWLRGPSEPERADPDKVLGALVKQLSRSEPSEPIREPVVVEYSKRKAVADVDGQDPKPLDVEN